MLFLTTLQCHSVVW